MCPPFAQHPPATTHYNFELQSQTHWQKLETLLLILQCISRLNVILDPEMTCFFFFSLNDNVALPHNNMLKCKSQIKDQKFTSNVMNVAKASPLLRISNTIIPHNMKDVKNFKWELLMRNWGGAGEVAIVVVNVAHDAGMFGGVNFGLRLGLEDHHGHNFSSILDVVACKEISKDLHSAPFPPDSS